MLRDQSIVKTEYQFPDQKSFYKGKVRDVYNISNKILVMVVTDRISAFDVVLPKGIPYKGQVLNQIANKFLDATRDIVPNWKIHSPDPMVTIGMLAIPLKIEMVIRGYLAGHVWRVYNSGKRSICGVNLPDGLNENDKFPEPIITPTTKAHEGHDEDISRDEILSQNIISEKDYSLMEDYTRKLFKRGTEMAAEKGLILVDTKYEFGKIGDEIVLIDEIHTPDSSRYFYLKGYEERQKNKEPQKQLSKEFLRQWLIERNFQGKKGQVVPEMPDELVHLVSERYIELYENITGEKFFRTEIRNISERIYNNIINSLDNLK